MDEASFKRILTTFTDSPADLNLQKGQLLLQLRDDLISVTVGRRDGSLYVTDNGVEYTAHRWIVERVARIPLLADRILSATSAEPNFVTPRASVIDEIERTDQEESAEAADAMAALFEMLRRDRVGTSGVVYLVSDAGEGKTTLINMLARQQAQAFKEKKVQWLLLPVSLGGRPFLRFDDVVAATLLNTLRFPLFFDSFVELVRMGVIVPALDGFEEMFVESAAGDAASALGNLVSLLDSSGTVMVAARQAYFDYKNLDTQARLYDALSSHSVSFACVRLERWTAEQFISYAEKRGLPRARHGYETLVEKLGSRHPLLTRAVLASRIVDLAVSTGSVDEVASQLDAGATDYFGELVRPIINREASTKWVDKSGEPFLPLLTLAEHLDLLSTVANEMWLGESAAVSADILEWSAELYCSGANKSAAITRQVVERVKQHALLVNRGSSGRGAYQFDHEEFYYYFLGRSVAQVMGGNDDTSLRAVLRRSTLPPLAIETAAFHFKGNAGKLQATMSKLTQVCRTEPAASFVRENAGAIVINALPEGGYSPLDVDGFSFPKDALASCSASNVLFRNCEFLDSEIGPSSLSNVEFRSCRFEALFVTSDTALSSTTFSKCSVRAIAAPGSAAPTYDPREVSLLLSQLSAKAGGADSTTSEGPVHVVQLDDDLKATDRLLRRFLRATELNENVIRQATGPYANQFVRVVLPELIRHEVVREVPYLGSGQQRRFRLGMQLSVLSGAMRESGGSFDRFLSLASQARR